jgi:twitching motility protein PilT
MKCPMFDIDEALRYLIMKEGSDLHLKVPSPPVIRMHGEMVPIDGAPPLTPELTEGALRQILDDPVKISEFETDHEVDFAYSIQGLARFRVNAFRQRGTVSLVMRAIPVQIKTIDELQLPPVIAKLAEEERGIILLTGTTGSGKSTTLAAMLNHMNATMRKHIVTIEDPIEFLHRDQKSIINQREVGMDTASFKRALRRVLRQDPDVILVGEMRDEETVQTALSAAETGHLVLSTLHTVDATEAINRIIDFFPPHQHQQARSMIAGTLKGIISQRLVKTADGKGRVATAEIMVMTGRVHDMILDPEQTGHLPEVIREGEFYGMQTFDQHLLKHLQAGRVTYEEAMKVASSPHDFKLMVQADANLNEMTKADYRPQAPEPLAPVAPPVPAADQAMHAMSAAAPAPMPAPVAQSLAVPAAAPAVVADFAPSGGSAPPPPSAAPPGI